MHAAIIEAADMPAGDGQIHAPDLYVGHLLGRDDGVAHIFLHHGGVGDLAFAHAA